MLVLQSLILGLFVALIAFYAKFRWSRRRFYELASKFPGPKGLPFFGISYKFLNKSFKGILEITLALSDGHGEEPVGAWLGPEFLIFADTPETLKTVLNSENCLDKSKVYEVFLARFGVGLSNGNIWKKHRKILNPAFSLNILQQLVPIFDAKSKILVKNIRSLVGGEQFDAYDRLSACSLETILKGTMELDRDIQSNYDKDEYLAHMDQFASILMEKVVNVFYKFPPYYWLSDLYKREQKHYVNGIEKFGYDIYDQHQSEAIMESSQGDDEFSKKPQIFIKTVLNPANEFTQQEIVDEINLMVIAGHETSARTISTALLLIAMYPEIQQKLFKELKEVLGDVESSIDHIALNKLTYLDMVIKECLRLFPVLAVVARNAKNEFKIKNYTIPKDATIVISIMKVQRSKKYWGVDAEQFRPERFEPESFAKIHPYAFIPFTGGPRNCIGYRYAMLFMKSVLANFLMKYEVATTMKFDEIELELHFLLKIAQGYMISISERKT